MKAPPTNTETIVFQLAIPVTNKITAPIKIANTEVSPIEPGIKPINASQVEIGLPNTSTAWKEPIISLPAIATCPSGVAPEKPSTTWPAPIPNVSAVRTNT